MSTIFQRRLRELRGKRAQCTTSELAGLSHDTIGKYERGDATPRLDSLVALADLFDVSVDYLLGRTDTRH